MSDLTRIIGKNIRIYRRANRMTIDTLAERINKSKATVGKYEQGAISMDVDTLYEIAEALKIAPTQLLLDTVSEQKETARGAGLSGEKRYLYQFDGRTNRIVKSLLVGAGDEAGSVTLFYDIVSFDEPQRCRALYYGRRRVHDFVTNYFLDNQSNEIEHVLLCVMRSLDRPTRSAGLLSGISSRMLLPASAKCILSAEPLAENDDLRASLLLTKEDMKLTKRYNMFMVEQADF